MSALALILVVSGIAVLARSNKGTAMPIDWSKPGYPPKHLEQIRATNRCAIRDIAITGILFVALLAGAILGPVPAIAPAIAAACFLVFGMFNGLGSLYDTYRYVQVIPYFERRLGKIHTFLAGQTMARTMNYLDAIATEENVPPLSTFGFADDLRGETLQWHDPKIGLKSIEAIRRRIADSDVPTAVLTPLLDDLKKWQQALERAASENIAFCVLLRHGNFTSGHEWDVRKGSAF